MKSNLIPITKIYDIYPKYTYSDDVKKFMDEIVDIDRADVYTKDKVLAMLEELQKQIEEAMEETNEEKIIIDKIWADVNLVFYMLKKEIEYGIN